MMDYVSRKAGGIGRLFALVAAMALQAAPSAAQTQTVNIDDGVYSEIKLTSGRTLNVETDKPFADILIGNTDVLDVFPLTDTSLYIQTKTFGATNISLYDEEKRLLEVIDVQVKADFTDLQLSIQAAVPSAQVNVVNVNNRVRLAGEVKNNVDAERVVQIAQQYTEQPVINALRVRAEQQVELDVRIIEVERNSGRDLGISFSGDDGSSIVNSGPSTAVDAAPLGLSIGSLLEISGMQVDLVINALESKGMARRLANPKLVATSGTVANFVAGGEVPIRRFAQDGQTETAYREFGVRLNFLPEVLDDELIRLRITPEVSDINEAYSAGVDPGFVTRRADTTVSLRSGQSFAIAGLLQTNNARSVDQVPWLGQVPILGTLFRSSSFQKRESDLVILVTPRIVRPTRPGEPLVSPMDLTRSSNDVELFLLGMLEVDKKTIRSFRDGDGINGVYGHIIDLEFDDGIIEKK